MNQFARNMLLAGSLLLGAASSAFAAAGALTPVVVTPLQDNVSYAQASPVLNTYAGFTVTGFANTHPNTINNLIVKFEASITDTAEKLALHQPEVYLSGLPAGCTWPTAAANTIEITCNIGQFKSGDAFPAFVVFFKVPTKVVNAVADGGANPDYISTRHTIMYAEGANDCRNGCDNSITVTPFPNQVLLGTANPINVRSGVPAGGGKLFTSNGVPKNEPNRIFTEEVLIPSLSQAAKPVVYGTSTLSISWVSSTDTTNGAQCTNLGNFLDCPTFTTTVLEPKANAADPDVPVLFKPSDPLRITYRIDGANVKRSANQLFSNVQITYIPDGGNEPVPVPKACVNDQASPDGVPCVLSFQCFKANDPTPGLARDCEFVTIGLKNGRLIIQ
jgi:hypothetical protein